MTRTEPSGRRPLAVIVAVSENGVIGHDGALPWHLPDDLARFRELTTGHAVIMGRRTYESIGRPLPRRRNIVLTRRSGWRAEGVLVAGSLDEAIESVPPEEQAFVIGGAAVYAEALPAAERLYMTVVHATVDGDVRFPELDLRDWALVEETRHPADERHAEAFTFRVYERSSA